MVLTARIHWCYYSTSGDRTTVAWKESVNKMSRPRRSEQPAQPNASLITGLECLQALAGSEEPIGSRDLAATLGAEHTRVNRLLGTLAAMGMAERTPDRKYVPGAGLHVLAAMSLRGSHLLAAALPHLDRLRAAEPAVSVALGVLWRRQVAYLFFADPGEPLQASIASRGLYAADQSSIGLTLLAGKDNRQLPTCTMTRPPRNDGPFSNSSMKSASSVMRWSTIKVLAYP